MSFPGIAEGFIDEGELQPDNLVAGEFPRRTEIITVSGAAELPAGSVLGRITASGVYVLSDAAAADGSEVPTCILAEAVDARTSDESAHAYFAGEFNSVGLNFGVGHTIDSVTELLRLRSIFLREVQA